MYQDLYSRFLSEHKNEWHFACHSHHYWPDVTRAAHIQYWDDSAKFVDDKWNIIFSEKIPRTQKLIANTLNLDHPAQIVFAPNTHEFVARLLSCLDINYPQKIVTTDSEFYSFDRQCKRYSEMSGVDLVKVPRAPFDTFNERFSEACQSADFIFFSQVAFNSGVAIDNLDELIESLPEAPIKVVDGYHGFMAVPTNLSRIQNKVFYLAGSYKYAQGGEGCCFMSVPKDCALRPLNTGWFAKFDDLSSEQSELIGYSEDGMRFAGSTMDYSALYRLLAVLDKFDEENITVHKIHKHVQAVQQAFLEHLDTQNHIQLNRDNLIHHDLSQHGHFYAFDMQTHEKANRLADTLDMQGVKTDYRKERLRFGFALYHNPHEMKFPIPG